MTSRPDEHPAIDLNTDQENSPISEMLKRLESFASKRGARTGVFRLLSGSSAPSLEVDDVWMVFPGERILVPRSRSQDAWPAMYAFAEPPRVNPYRRIRRLVKRFLMRIPVAARSITPAWAICPGFEEITQGVMLGNGTRARLFDFDHGFVYQLPITASELAFFESEVKTRLVGAAHVPVPELIEYDFGELPYAKEELVRGRPWRGNLGTDPAPVTLLRNLAEMYRSFGIQREAAGKYLQSLGNRLIELSDQCGRSVPNGLRLVDTLKRNLDHRNIGSIPITLVTAHGDFTAKNFLQESRSNRTLLVDWEYAGTSTLLHDAIHFTVVPILESGQPGLMADFIEGDGNGPGSRLLSALGPEDQGFDNPDGRRFMVGLYFLEREIRFLERFAVHSQNQSNIALRFDRNVTTIELAISATDGGINPALVKERLDGASIR